MRNIVVQTVLVSEKRFLRQYRQTATLKLDAGTPTTLETMMEDLKAQLSDASSELHSFATAGDAFTIFLAPDPHAQANGVLGISRLVAVMIVSCAKFDLELLLLLSPSVSTYSTVHYYNNSVLLTIV